ncbi:hypothetical protein V5O48_008373 [Marasmius crinis-equi]|uniref:Uncharacterized protein n=1 Tax=Marasmius crinis-equi TaxID=585013 RepID=A0ABR3FE33_9AGAR
MTMTTSFLKKHQNQRQVRRKASSSTLGKGKPVQVEKRRGIKTSDIRLPRPPRDDHDYLNLSFQFPYPPLPTPSNPNFSPFSSPSSTSSGLPITPESSPQLRATQNTKRASVRPLTIVKRNTDLSFGNFFSSPLEDEEVEPISPLEGETDAFIIIPPLSPLSEHDERSDSDSRSASPSSSSDAESDDDYYTHAIGSLLTLTTSMPQQSQSQASSRRESIVMSKPQSELPLDSDLFSPRRACFPSSQLDPAWRRRSFLIPSRPPPPPPSLPSTSVSSPESSPSPSPSPSPEPITITTTTTTAMPFKITRPRPPSLMIAKPLPRMSVVPLDTVEEDEFDEASLFSYYAASSPSLNSSSSSSYPDTESSTLDDFDVQFEVDFDSELKFPVSLPGSPSDIEEEEAGLEVIEEEHDSDIVEEEQEGEVEADDEDEDQHAQFVHAPAPPLRSKWSSSTLSSVNHLQSPRTPSSSAVTKFKLYLRGSLGGKDEKEKDSGKKAKGKGKRGVVVLGPSASTASPASPAPFSPGARSTRFAVPVSPSSASSWSFGSPRSPTFSDLGMGGMQSFGMASASASAPGTKPPVPTSPKPAMYTNTRSPAGIRRRPSTSSTNSSTSAMSSGSERLRRKPIPVEMFLRA